MHPQLALVVIGAARPDAAVAHNRLEGVRAPLGTRIDRHDIIMAVDEDRAGLRVDDLLGIDNGIALRGHHLGPVGPGLHQGGSQPFGATLHIRPVGGFGTDRRDADQIEQLIDEAIVVGFDITLYLVHIHSDVLCKT